MSLFVSIEVRPRLGAANVFIKGKGQILLGRFFKWTI